MEDTKDKALGVTPQEEKEMHRVFELLCDYQQKTKIKEEMKDLLTHIDESRAIAGQIEKGSRLGNSIETAEKRLQELTTILNEVEGIAIKKISCSDVAEMYKFLKFKVSRKEIEEMIWEVDENLDEHVDWAEFRLMFNRNIMDRTGLEANRMFNLVQFLIYDTNGNGCVSVDETMNLLYARYGRTKMEMKLKELFGEDMHETGRQGGEISFSKFLKAVEVVQMGSFLSTTKGRIAASRGFGKTMKNKSSKNSGH
jgi:calmodulin